MRITEKNQCIILEAKIIPRSSKNSLDILGDLVKIKLKSPPVDGKANKELISFLAKKLSLKKSDIKILHGETSKNKSIMINNISKKIFLEKIGGKE